MALTIPSAITLLPHQSAIGLRELRRLLGSRLLEEKGLVFRGGVDQRVEARTREDRIPRRLVEVRAVPHQHHPAPAAAAVLLHLPPAVPALQTLVTAVAHRLLHPLLHLSLVLFLAVALQLLPVVDPQLPLVAATILKTMIRMNAMSCEKSAEQKQGFACDIVVVLGFILFRKWLGCRTPLISIILSHEWNDSY